MFLAMAYYEGRALDDVIDEGPLPLDKAVAVATQTANALMHAHEMNVTHRDIKPSNILLTARGDVRILDFGLAKQRSRDSHGPGNDSRDTGLHGAGASVRQED